MKTEKPQAGKVHVLCQYEKENVNRNEIIIKGNKNTWQANSWRWKLFFFYDFRG